MLLFYFIYVCMYITQLHYTFTTALPVLSPRKIPARASTILSNPSVTVSRHCNLPSFIHFTLFVTASDHLSSHVVTMNPFISNSFVIMNGKKVETVNENFEIKCLLIVVAFIDYPLEDLLRYSLK